MHQLVALVSNTGEVRLAVQNEITQTMHDVGMNVAVMCAPSGLWS
jgi:hypothetical protein